MLQDSLKTGKRQQTPSVPVLSRHLPPVPLQKKLNVPGCSICCDLSTTQSSQPAYICRQPSLGSA